MFSATLQTTPASRGSAGASLREVWAPVPLLLLLLLDLTFNLYFWRIPKLTSPSEDWGYQFLFDTHRLEREKSDDKALRVLAFASSVSGAFDPYQIQTLVNATHPSRPVEVYRLMKPGIKPSDYRIFFKGEQGAIRPQIAVVLFNFQDFLNPSFERELKADVQNVLPPWTTLRERHTYIPTVSEKLDLLLASTSNFYRYRRPIRSCVQDHIRALIAWLRSARSSGGYGFYPDGYTRQWFGLPAGPAAALDLEYDIAPEWIRQRGQVTLGFSMGGHVIGNQIETAPGWKTIHVQLPATRKRVLHVAADSTWNPRAAGLSEDVRLLGVRLRATPPSSAIKGKQPYRYPPIDKRDMSPFLRMGSATGDEFVKRWQAALEAKTDFGTRFRAWRDSKLRMRDQMFEPTGEYAEMRRLVADLSAQGISIVLVNTPESPLIGDYRNGPYYRGYLQFFQDLAQQYPHVRFYDLVAALPAEDFNDPIHVNHIGVIKLGPVFADMVRAAAADLGAAR